MTAARAGLGGVDRRRASAEAVYRRRENRKARKACVKKKPSRAEEEAIRRLREELVVARLVRRYIPYERRTYPLFREYSYWQARRCGWDVTHAGFRASGRRDADGEPILLEPEDTPTWLWWSSLHYTQRYTLAGGGRFSLRGEPPAVDAEAVGVMLPDVVVFEIAGIEITHPDFYLESAPRLIA